jgi:hypothetical protein
MMAEMRNALSLMSPLRKFDLCIFRDLRRPDFGGTVPILRAVFRVPPGYMAGHTFVPLFKTFGLR